MNYILAVGWKSFRHTYNGKEGIVEKIDDADQIHGSWGGCAIIPETDKYIIIE